MKEVEEQKDQFMRFIIIFLIIPLAEVFAFLNVGKEIGILNTLLLCVLTAVVGGFLVRLQGLEMLIKAQASLIGGKMPLNEIFSGFCIVVSGALLLTPGFVTDILGFLLLFPPFRSILKDFLSKNTNFNAKSYQYRPNNDNDDTIEGQYERVDKNNPAIDSDNKAD